MILKIIASPSTYIIIVFFYVYNLSITSISAQELPLSLYECISHAVANNVDLKVSILEKEKETSKLIYEKAILDPHLNLSTNHSNSNEPTITTIEGTNIKTTEIYAEIEKEYIFGSKLSLFFYDARINSNSEYQTINPLHQSAVGFSLTQPLINNSFGIQNKNKIKNAEKSIILSQYNVKKIEENLIYETIQKYIDIAYYKEKISIYNKYISLNESLLAFNQKRKRIGLATEADIIENRAAIVSAYNDVTELYNELNKVNKDLLIKIGFEKNDAFIKIEPIYAFKGVVEKWKSEDCIKQALINRSDCHAQKKELEINETKERIYKNSILPSFDLNSSIRKSGIGSSLNDTTAYIRKEDAMNWNIGLSFSMPLHTWEAKSNYEQAQYDVTIAQEKCKALEKKIIFNIEAFIVTLLNVAERIKLSKVNIDLCQQKLEHEKKMFNIGKSTNRDVLLQQKDLISAQLTYLDNLYEYEQVKLDVIHEQELVSQKYYNQ